MTAKIERQLLDPGEQARRALDKRARLDDPAKSLRFLAGRGFRQSLARVADPIFGSYERLVSGAPSRLIARLNERVSEVVKSNGVLLVDVARVSERDGLDAWFDVKRWLQAKFEIAPQAAPLYGELVARIIAAPSKGL